MEIVIQVDEDELDLMRFGHHQPADEDVRTIKQRRKPSCDESRPASTDDRVIFTTFTCEHALDTVEVFDDSEEPVRSALDEPSAETSERLRLLRWL